MNLQEIAAKVTGLESRFTTLTEAAETATAANAELQSSLEEAQGVANTLTEANAELTKTNEEQTANLAAAEKKIVDLEAAAQTVEEAASQQAVDIAASQGAEAGAEVAADIAAPAKSKDALLKEMAALPIEARHAFYQEHRQILNPHN